MDARLGLLLVVFVAACVERALPPPPPELPEPPAPLSQGYVQAHPEPPANVPDPPGLSRPHPTGDRERDALALGFWGCRVMGARLEPGLSGRAELRATLGAAGEVLDVIAERVENLPRPVVQCLLERVAHARFDPRGGYGSYILIPVDFTKPSQPAVPTIGTAVPTQTL
jgi:hypothetical protein